MYIFKIFLFVSLASSLCFCFLLLFFSQFSQSGGTHNWPRPLHYVVQSGTRSLPAQILLCSLNANDQLHYYFRSVPCAVTDVKGNSWVCQKLFNKLTFFCCLLLDELPNFGVGLSDGVRFLCFLDSFGKGVRCALFVSLAWSLFASVLRCAGRAVFRSPPEHNWMFSQQLSVNVLLL